MLFCDIRFAICLCRLLESVEQGVREQAASVFGDAHLCDWVGVPWTFRAGGASEREQGRDATPTVAVRLERTARESCMLLREGLLGWLAEGGRLNHRPAETASLKVQDKEEKTQFKELHTRAPSLLASRQELQFQNKKKMRTS